MSEAPREDGRHVTGGEQERIVPGTALWDAQYPEHQQRYEFAMQHLPANSCVLDAGCGVGYGAALIADRGARKVVAVDLSEAALAVARARFERPQVAWIAEDCHELAAAGGHAPFDLVVNLENLEHLARPERFLARAGRLLGPGGTLVTSVPNRIGSNRLRGLGPGERTPNPYHFREYTREEFRALLLQHFSDVELCAQTYRPLELMLVEPVLAALWSNPMARLGRFAQKALGRRAPRYEDLVPARRWQIVRDPELDDAMIITNLAVCRGPRAAGA